MLWDPSDDDSETYKLKIAMFENGQPEEFLALMKNFKRAIDGIGTTSEAGKINYIRTLLTGSIPRHPLQSHYLVHSKYNL